MKLEGIISYVDNIWSCHFPDFSIQSENLNTLDYQIIEKLTAKNLNGEFEIHLNFDITSIPIWYRQYMSHYFNRIFTFSIN